MLLPPAAEGDSIIETKILKISDEYEQETNWEDIESIYNLNNIIYICPRGKNYVNKYTQSNGLQEIKTFTGSNDWDLICYYQTNEKYFFIAYANNYQYIYYTKNADVIDLSTANWITDGATQIYDGLCDFKWTINKNPNNNGNNEYFMNEIIIRDNYVTLQRSIFTINGGRGEDVNRNDGGDSYKKKLIKNLSNSYGYFSEDNYSFYFFSYNDTHLQVGYYETTGSFENNEINSITPIIKEESPLDFFYDFKIEKIKYIRNTNYIYYEIYNEIINQKYYGFIDIKLNKVIFNTDIKILSYNKISSNTLLIRTEDSAYSICKIKDGDICIDTCSSNNLIINSLGSNFCGTDCSSNLIMKPNDICIDECDENKYYKIGNECGLCKDLNEDKKYKIINTTGCIEDIIEGTEIYIEKNNILKCKEDYILNDGSCISKADTTEEVTVETTVSSTNPLENQCEEGKIRLKYYNPKNNSENFRCIENTTERIYYDSSDHYYKLCYETCLACRQGGNKIRNNCTKCEKDFRDIQIDFNTKEFNCVAKCPYFYINSYNQYKCIDHLPCPKEAKYFINNTNQCIDNCKRDRLHNFAYDGNCVEKCPNGTRVEVNDPYNLCKYLDNDTFKLSTNVLELNYTSFIGEIDTYVGRYSNEFSYTNKHVTQFKNEEYTAIIYKDSDSINELSLDFPNLDFGECYQEVKSKNNITQDLIVVIINKNDDDNNPDTSYSFYHPITGEKLETEKICKSLKVKVIENISSLIKNLSNYNSIMSLVNQGINLFNSSDKFYTDICYDYNFDTNKDIALKDRLKVFYPNVSLCDDGCNTTDVNLEKMTAHCECEFNDISTENDKKGKNILKDNVLIENLMGKVFDFIDSSNIGVGKCLKKGTKHIFKCYGLFLFLFLIVLDSIMTILYFISGLKKYKYIFMKIHLII